ncbi:IclR family transcriptional regulator [Paracoccus sp. (in: a-proteobacteria)]|uniref:IclR family transcriptional regulator n=1 Tax=Paracoccus sp. TaxID=267 RepID=UPI003A87DC97
MSVLHKAGEVLRLFGAGCTDLTVTEVATRLSMPKANASRLLKAMREAGMLEAIGGSRRHRPGRMMLDLPAAFRRSSDLIGRCSVAIAQVNHRFGHTCYISVLEGREVTAVADFEGSNPLRVVSMIGRRLPAATTSTGRTLLARRPDAEIRALYPNDPGLERLLARVAQTRAEGFAYSSDESIPGVDTLAIAVGDPATDEMVSLCIVYPHAIDTPAERHEMLAALAGAAARIANELEDAGFVAPNIDQEGRSE